ncbi:hypothetical protein FB45DRAFT_904336 [Roridomyces roridus]|uniref:Uncharacterized protein n=1 Tax=Roridomyces roridus TaxID=1738132 RepID=A0AAD7C4Y4_9AGAR|nr:hypothetical protein FB45DRAFT_904336 [Roridomyces roridus]
MNHGDLYEENILNYDGHPVLIDLKFAEEHKCVINMKIVMGAITPTVEEYGCPELYELILERLGLWKSATVGFCSQMFRKDDITCPEDLIKNMPAHFNEERQEIEKQAMQVFQEIVEERRLTYGTDKLYRESFPGLALISLMRNTQRVYSVSTLSRVPASMKSPLAVIPLLLDRTFSFTQIIHLC